MKPSVWNHFEREIAWTRIIEAQCTRLNLIETAVECMVKRAAIDKLRRREARRY